MFFVFCAGIVSACANQTTTDAAAETTTAMAQLDVEVLYRERMALPPEAQIEVTLSDVSRQDVAAIVIAQEKIKADGKQVPFTFVLPYDPAQIDPRHTYSVSARITVADKLLFISTERFSVQLDGSDPSPVMVRVNRVSGQ